MKSSKIVCQGRPFEIGKKAAFSGISKIPPQVTLLQCKAWPALWLMKGTNLRIRLEEVEDDAGWHVAMLQAFEDTVDGAETL